MTDQKKVLGISLVTALSIATGSPLLAADKKTAAEIGAEYAANVPKVMDGKKYPGLHHTTAIPTNFPLPKYPNHVISTNFVNSVKGTPVASLGIVTTDPPKTVFSWYQNQCQGSGWSASLPPQNALTAKEKSGDLYRMSAFKNSQQLTISCSKLKSGHTAVGITWVLESKK
ncbi:MAG TPA: hypothetical protein V6C86_03285 [Oculatellaceae cyanobacterium]